MRIRTPKPPRRAKPRLYAVKIRVPRKFDPKWHRVPNYSYTENWALTRSDSTVRTDNGVASSHAYTATTNWSSLRQRRYGDNLQNWRELIIAGKNATTSADNYDCVLVDTGNYSWDFGRRLVFGSNVTQFETSFRGAYIPTGLGLIPPATVPSSVSNRALSAFVSKARKAQRSAMTGEFLHDLGKTIKSFHRVRAIFGRAINRNLDIQLRMREQIFGRTFTRLRKASRMARFREGSKALADNWLEFNYGIAPTVSDLEDISFGIYRAYSRTRNGVDSRYCKGWAVEQSVQSAQADIPASNGSADSQPVVRATLRQDLTYYASIFGAVRTLVDQGVSGSLQSELGLGLRDFVPTLWELVPYSFLVDYFTNLGDIIEALCFPRSDVLWSAQLIRIEKRSTVSYAPIFPFGVTGQISRNNFTYTPTIVVTTRYARSTYTGSYVPTFRWHLPYRGTDWLNIFALGISRGVIGKVFDAYKHRGTHTE